MMNQIKPANTIFNKSGYNRFLLLVAGLGGLLYGVDVGIIAGALPYLEATSGLTAGQLSFIVAAVLAGSVISTIFSGMLSDWLGRKKMMIISGVLFVISIPMIALAQGFTPLVLGRLLQGISAGFIGVAVPLYLAECLGASNRGKGTGVFQWLLTLGICAAALIAMGFSTWLGGIESAVEKGTATAQELFNAKNLAWRSIFWVSLPPGILFIIGAFIVSESPRWLFRKGPEKPPSLRCSARARRSRPRRNCGKWKPPLRMKARSASPARRSRNRCCAVNISFPSSWHASFSPVIRPRASTPSSVTMPRF